MAKDEVRYTNFRDLGAAFGLTPPKRTPEEVDRMRALRVPINQKLSLDFDARQRNAPNAGSLIDGALGEVFEMRTTTRAKHRIRLVAMVPQGVELPNGDPTLSYPVHVVFPHPKLGTIFLSTTRTAWAGMIRELSEGAHPPLEALQRVDEVVVNDAELRPELLHDRYNRLVAQVKLNDAGISEEKKSSTTHRNWGIWVAVDKGVFAIPYSQRQKTLNDDKNKHTLAYLDDAQALASAHPDLDPLFVVNDSRIPLMLV
ncbi:MAG TPA: hypothetical protein VJG66_00935 [Patescibacteria group bacterium]|nr:hypothetical protein [Patescibacteria group bacterium]